MCCCCFFFYSRERYHLSHFWNTPLVYKLMPPISLWILLFRSVRLYGSLSFFLSLALSLSFYISSPPPLILGNLPPRLTPSSSQVSRTHSLPLPLVQHPFHPYQAYLFPCRYISSIYSLPSPPQAASISNLSFTLSPLYLPSLPSLSPSLPSLSFSLSLSLPPSLPFSLYLSLSFSLSPPSLSLSLPPPSLSPSLFLSLPPPSLSLPPPSLSLSLILFKREPDLLPKDTALVICTPGLGERLSRALAIDWMAFSF